VQSRVDAGGGEITPSDNQASPVEESDVRDTVSPSEESSWADKREHLWGSAPAPYPGEGRQGRPQGHASLTAAPGRPRSAAVTEPAAALQRAHERLRQYFPKGTDLNDVSRAQLAIVAVKMNGRPRGVRNWRTPAEAYHDLVATAA